MILVLLSGCARLFGFDEAVVAEPADDPPVPAVRCSTTQSLSDAFWAKGEATSTDNGALRFAFPSNDLVDVSAIPLLDVRDSSFSVEVVTPANIGMQSRVAVVLEAPRERVPATALHTLELRLISTTLEALVTRGDAFMTVAQTTYDPIAHRFWKLAEADGEVTWSTSPDGDRYTELARFAVPDVSMVRPRIEAIRGSDAPIDFELRIESVNAGVERDPACAAETLREAFEGELDPYVWELVDHATVRDGRAVLQATSTSGTASASLHPGTAYDLAGEGITVEIATFDVTDPTSVVSVIAEPLGGGDDFVAFQIRDTLVARTADAELGSATYEPSAHRFLRLRADGDVAIWEVSPDGVEFSVFAQATNRDLGTAMLVFDAFAESSIEVELAGINAP